jgi:hypothetical protein
MSIEIIEVTKSNKKNKRLRIMIEDEDGIEKVYDFGLDAGSTYIDHQDEKKREAYRKRHYANKKEKRLIDGNIPSPALFSYRLLWGDSPDITQNIVDLQRDFNKI